VDIMAKGSRHPKMSKADFRRLKAACLAMKARERGLPVSVASDMGQRPDGQRIDPTAADAAATTVGDVAGNHREQHQRRDANA
jgi:hypothetical protein